MENGIESTYMIFVDYCNSLGIQCEFTAPRTRQENGPIESAIRAGHAARLGVPQLFPDVRLEETRGCTDAEGTSLWLESLIWGCECFNRATLSANDGWLSSHEVFSGSRPPLPLLPFSHPAFYRMPRQQKTEHRTRICYFVNIGYNHGLGCY